MMMLEVRDLSVAYGKHQALKDAALHVSSGEIVVILGANGAGKSTLLKAVSGICEGQVQGAVTLRRAEFRWLACGTDC
jgi:branched-chain amino acid transport system ATP-binding protein